MYSYSYEYTVSSMNVEKEYVHGTGFSNDVCRADEEPGDVARERRAEQKSMRGKARRRRRRRQRR